MHKGGSKGSEYGLGVKHGHGVVKQAAGRGMTFNTPYGKDDSGYANPSKERMQELGGGVDNIIMKTTQRGPSGGKSD